MLKQRVAERRSRLNFIGEVDLFAICLQQQTAARLRKACVAASFILFLELSAKAPKRSDGGPSDLKLSGVVAGELKWKAAGRGVGC
jgi:hypothetical protein